LQRDNVATPFLFLFTGKAMLMTAANIFAGIMFGSIGFGAFIYGKKQSNFKALGIGIALMAYPYFVPNTIAVYAIGALLTAALIAFRD